MTATILRPTGFARAIAEGHFLSERANLNSVASDAKGDEILFDGVGSTFAKRQVVLGRASLVAMAVDPNDGRGPFAEPLRVLLERAPAVLTQRALVVIEEHIAEGLFRIQLIERFPLKQVGVTERRRGR
jgi:hypothetical protein